MFFICSEFHYAAKRNQIFQVSDVWLRYNKQAQETNIQISQSFISRATSFKENLKKTGACSNSFSRWRGTFKRERTITYFA